MTSFPSIKRAKDGKVTYKRVEELVLATDKSATRAFFRGYPSASIRNERLSRAKLGKSLANSLHCMKYPVVFCSERRYDCKCSNCKVSMELLKVVEADEK